MPQTEKPYQQLVDELEQARQKIAQLEAAHQTQAEIQQRAESLTLINELSKKLASASPDTDVFALIAESLRTITGALGVGISSYQPQTRELEVKYVAAASDSQLAQFKKLLRRKLIGMRLPLPPDKLEHMFVEGVVTEQDLSEISFGVIPPSVANLAQKMFNIGDIFGLAFHDDNELLGSAVIVMPQDSPPLCKNLMKVFAQVAAVSFRRKQAEKALRESEIRFDAIVENSSDIVILLNADGTARYVSPAIEPILGYVPQSLVGQDAFSYIHPDDLSLARASFKQVMQRPGTPVKTEFRLRHANGFWVSFETLTNNLLNTPEVQMVIVNARDISERKRAQAAILQASRLETATTLASGFAHRVNNLMTTAIGYTELLQFKLAADPKLLVMLEQILAATQQTGDLAQQMVAFTRGGKYEIQLLDLNHILKELLEWQYSILPVGIHLDYNLTPDLWPIEADPTQMRQVILNLLTNAVEAIEGTGTIIVATENIIIDKTNQKQSDNFLAGPYICLSIVDTGHGMTTDTLSKVFEPFFTTKFQGRGMGLAAAYGIVDNHNGHISMTSRPEEGTTCQVYLPAVRRKPGKS